MNDYEFRPMLGQRTLLILLLGFLIGSAGDDTADAVRIAGAAKAITFFNTMLD